MHREHFSAVCRLKIDSGTVLLDSLQLKIFLTIFLRNKRPLLSLRESRREVLYRGSDEESHLDTNEESRFFAEKEGSPRDVDCDARNAATPVPDGLRQETDLNVGEGDQAAVGYDAVDGNMQLMSENNVLAQGIKHGMKVNVNRRFFIFILFTFLSWRLQ